MIVEKEGDLLASLENGEVNVAVHCCNCEAVMGAGIAAAFASKWPQVAEVDREAFDNHQAKLGYFSGVRVHSEEKGGFVINLYGQEKPNKHERAVNYEAIYSGMERLRQVIEKKEATNLTIGFPKKMGSDLAGGDWNVIKAMIESVWGDWPAYVYIIEKKG